MLKCTTSESSRTAPSVTSARTTEKIGGTIGDVGSWSFENSKHLTTGDGGIIACNDEGLADRIRKLNCLGFRNATAVSGKIRIAKEMFRNPSYKHHDT